MNILFLTLSFPNKQKGGNLYVDLAREFMCQGHKIYPVAPAEGDKNTRISEENGIDVLRVKTMKLFNVNAIRKGIANLMLPLQYRRAIQKYYSDAHFDLVIMPTPPITLEPVVRKIKSQHNTAKFYLILRDIFPQNAVDLGILTKTNPMYYFFRKQEKKLYNVVDYIGCMSQGNIDYIVKNNPEVVKQKFHILQNFQKIESFTKNDFDYKIKEKYGLKDKFVVVFGGNMGIPQKLENVISLAKECEKYKDVIFFLIGEGTQRKIIEDMVVKNNITNVKFNDYIPHEDYQRLVSQCDIGLISLNECFTIPNIPSRTLSYFNLSIPVLASLDAATDYGQILEEAGAGLWSLAGDIATYKANFDILYQNPSLRKKMGRNGRKYFEKNMSTEVAYQVIMSHVK